MDTTEEVWDRMMGLNLRSVFLLCKNAISQMVRRGSPEFAAYSTSKGDLISLTKSLALDYGKDRIRANAICPGASDTPGGQQFMQEQEAYMKIIASVTTLRCTGKPKDIANGAVYLASEESCYVSGTTLIVDTGRTATA